MLRKLFVLACVLMMTAVAAFCGNGKISGTVVDAEAKEPLIGANVLITGTSLGAATDVEGRFVILSVPPGAYTLRTSYVGYQDQIVSNIRVSADLTSQVDFSLRPTATELPPIIIVAERPLVNKNATNAVRISTGEELEKLPVRGVQNAVVLAPGVVFQDNRLYIRGGRSDEVGYYLEGASTRNVVDGTNLTNIIPEALEEFQVHAGGYNAEYGGANSGIVRQTLKAGTPDFKGSLMAETDNLAPWDDPLYTQRLGTYSYGYSNYVATLSGPIYKDKVKFFIAGENRFDRDTRVQFWDGFKFENLADRNSNDTVRLLEIQPGNFPGMFRNRYSTNGTLTFDFKPFVVRAGGTFTHEKRQGTSLPIENIFNLGRLPIVEQSDLLGTLKFTHLVTPTIVYEVNLFGGDNRLKQYDPDHGDNYLLYDDSLANAANGYQYRNYTTGPDNYNLYGFPFDRPGIRQGAFIEQWQTRVGGSGDLIMQLGSIHEFKAGFSLESYRVRRYATTGRMLVFYRNDPDLGRTPGARRDYQVRRNGNVDNYGYDVYGNQIESGIDGPKKPLFYAGYIQDKLEYEDLIINAGLRFDYFDTDDFEFIDDPNTPFTDTNGNGLPDPGEPGVEGPNNPSVDPTSFDYLPSGISKTKPFRAISPRLGFSYPVTDRTVFHVQFGKFIQAPGLNTLYTGRGQLAVNLTGGNYIPNPVGQNLDPERTTQYEIGFTQQVSDFASFDVTGFYKDIQGQIQLVRQVTTSSSTAAGYNTLANGDFATTKGVEFSFRLRRIERFQGQLAYTFADAKGTGSTTNSAVSSIENGTLYPTVISPLDFNQTHRGSINLDYRFGKDDGGIILEGLGLNMLFTFNSGHPFTLSSGGIGQQGAENGGLIENDARASQPLEAVNASTTPWNFSLDLRLDKTMSLGPLDANFYVYVQNVFNTRNVINVYRRTGNAEDDGFLTNPDLSSQIVSNLGPQYVELFKAINLENGQHYRRVTGNDLWGSPRQIRFGMKLEI
jgi:outer membrane receptor protein involved in Fe transport